MKKWLNDYQLGGISIKGYRNDSPHKNRDFNIINSPYISMQNVPHPVLGIDNFGNKQMMQPGGEYQFQGDRVFEVPAMKEGGIPQRYKTMGFSRVGQKKSGDGQHKWKVLAKKGDSYKVVQGGYRGMQDFKQHHSEERKDRFWDRMGGRDSSKAKDPFSPLYWHKRFGTWEYGGPVEMQDGGQNPPKFVTNANDPSLQSYRDSLQLAINSRKAEAEYLNKFKKANIAKSTAAFELPSFMTMVKSAKDSYNPLVDLIKNGLPKGDNSRQVVNAFSADTITQAADIRRTTVNGKIPRQINSGRYIPNSVANKKIPLLDNSTTGDDTKDYPQTDLKNIATRKGNITQENITPSRRYIHNNRILADIEDPFNNYGSPSGGYYKLTDVYQPSYSIYNHPTIKPEKTDQFYYNSAETTDDPSSFNYQANEMYNVNFPIYEYPHNPVYLKDSPIPKSVKPTNPAKTQIQQLQTKQSLLPINRSEQLLTQQVPLPSFTPKLPSDYSITLRNVNPNLKNYSEEQVEFKTPQEQESYIRDNKLHRLSTGMYEDVTKYKQGGMIKRADGSYSQRGLWDNIRANAGSGKKPTKEMLQQEKKIRGAEKKEYGGWLDQYQSGGTNAKDGKLLAPSSPYPDMDPAMLQGYQQMQHQTQLLSTPEGRRVLTGEAYQKDRKQKAKQAEIKDKETLQRMRDKAAQQRVVDDPSMFNPSFWKEDPMSGRTYQQRLYDMGTDIDTRVDPRFGNFIDYIQPASYAADVAKSILQAPLKSKQENSAMPYVWAAAPILMAGTSKYTLDPLLGKAMQKANPYIRKAIRDIKSLDDQTSIAKQSIGYPTLVERLNTASNTITNEGKKIMKDLSSSEGTRRLRNEFKNADNSLTDEQLDYLVFNRINEVKDALIYNEPSFALNELKTAPNLVNTEKYFPVDNAWWNRNNPYPNVSFVQASETLFPKVNKSAFNTNNPLASIKQKNVGYQTFADPNYKPGSITLGHFLENNKKVLDHEIAHAIQKGGEMPIDNKLKNLLSEKNIFDRIFNRLITKESKMDKSYFTDAGGGRRFNNEAYPFAVEQRRKMIERGILNDRYDEITPWKLAQARLTALKNKEKNYIEGDRLIKFTPFWKYKQLSEIMNEAPALIPITGALGAGVTASQADNQKYGGWLNEYQSGGVATINSNTPTGVSVGTQAYQDWEHRPMPAPYISDRDRQIQALRMQQDNTPAIGAQPTWQQQIYNRQAQNNPMLMNTIGYPLVAAAKLTDPNYSYTNGNSGYGAFPGYGEAIMDVEAVVSPLKALTKKVGSKITIPRGYTGPMMTDLVPFEPTYPTSPYRPPGGRTFPVLPARNPTGMPTLVDVPELTKEQQILKSFGLNYKNNTTTGINTGSNVTPLSEYQYYGNSPTGNVSNNLTSPSKYPTTGPRLTGQDIEDLMNERLQKGYGIKKIPQKVSVKYEKGNPYSHLEEPEHTFRINVEGRGIGSIGLKRTKVADHNIPGVDHPIYEKVADYPYDFATNTKVIEGSGVSGEVNKSLTDVLQEQGRGHLYSSNKHTEQGFNRWENLVNKGKAERITEGQLHDYYDPFAEETVKTSNARYKLLQPIGIGAGIGAAALSQDNKKKQYGGWLSKYK